MTLLHICKMTVNMTNLRCKLLVNLHSVKPHSCKINTIMWEQYNLVLEWCKLVFTLQSLTQFTCKMNQLRWNYDAKLIFYLQSVSINLHSYLLQLPNIYNTTTIIKQLQRSSYLPLIQKIFNLSFTLQLVNDLIKCITSRMWYHLSSNLKLVINFFHYIYDIGIGNVIYYFIVYAELRYMLTLSRYRT